MTPLFAELQRVATAPYAVSLKTLLDALQSPPPPATAHAIRLWAAAHPCLVPGLASALLAALEYCPFAQSCLEILARVKAVRDAVLKQRRTFLDGLLKIANSSDKQFSKYSPLIIALLTHHLPSHSLPLPASIREFFLTCVESATTTPTPTTIRDIYTLVSGSCTPLSHFLSKEQTTMFLGRMLKFLYEDAQGVVLGALATLTYFHQQPQEHGSSSGVNPEVKAYFDGKKTQKLLELVIINVITVITAAGNGGGSAADQQSTWEERVEKLQYAIAIIKAVSQEKKDAYMEDRKKGKLPVENLLRKMEKLVGEEGADPDGRMLRLGLRFCVQLSPGRPVGGLKEFVERLVRKTLDEEMQGKGNVVLEESMAEIFAVHPPEAILYDFLVTSLNLSSNPLPLNTSSISRLQERIALLSALAEKITVSMPLRKAILCSLSTDALSTPLRVLINTNCREELNNRSDCTNSDVCSIALLRTQRELSRTLCILLLTGGLHVDIAEDIERLRPSLGTALLLTLSQLSTYTGANDNQCTMESMTSFPTQMPLILEATATPGTHITSHDWRSRLLSELTRDAAKQHTGIVSTLGEICRDLERRCEGVEKPLKEEQARCESLSKELGEAKERERRLEASIDRKRVQMEEMRREHDGVEIQLDAAIEKIHEGEDSLKKLKEELDAERKGRKEDEKKVVEEREKVAEEHLGELAEQGAKLAGLETKLEQLEGTIRELKGELVTVTKKLEVEKREGIRLSADLGDRSRELEERQRKMEQMEAELAQNDKELEDLSVRLDRTLEERDAQIQVQVDKIAELERIVAETVMARDAAVEKKDAEVARLVVEMRELETAAQSREQDVQGLEERIEDLDALLRNTKAKLEQGCLELERIKADGKREVEKVIEEKHKEAAMLAEEKRFEVDRAQIEKKHALEHFQNIHEKEQLALQAQLQQTRDEWTTTRESLHRQIRAWEKKFERYQLLQERKARELSEASELTKKLMATMGAAVSHYTDGSPGSPLAPPRLASASASASPSPPPDGTVPFPPLTPRKKRKLIAHAPASSPLGRPVTRRRVAETAVGMGGVGGNVDAEGEREGKGGRETLIPDSCVVAGGGGGGSTVGVAAAPGEDSRKIQKKPSSNVSKNLTSRSPSHNARTRAPGLTATITTTAASRYQHSHGSPKPGAVVGKENVIPQQQVDSRWPRSAHSPNTGRCPPVDERADCGALGYGASGDCPGDQNEDDDGTTEDEQEEAGGGGDEEYAFGDSMAFTSTPSFGGGDDGGCASGGGEG